MVQGGAHVLIQTPRISRSGCKEGPIKGENVIRVAIAEGGLKRTARESSYGLRDIPRIAKEAIFQQSPNLEEVLAYGLQTFLAPVMKENNLQEGHLAEALQQISPILQNPDA